VKKNVLIAGVGGQGGLSLSRIIAVAAVRSGYRARTGETLGMAQRGGSVFSYVRFGEDVMGPLIEEGGADVLLGLEPLEAARAYKYVSEKTLAVIDPTPRPTILNISGKEEYPNVEELLDIIKKRVKELYTVKARDIAKELGSARSANLVLLARYLRIEQVLSSNVVKEAIFEVLGEKKGELASRIFEEALKRFS